MWGLLYAKPYVVDKGPPVGVAWKLGEGMPAQMSPSSSSRTTRYLYDVYETAEELKISHVNSKINDYAELFKFHQWS
ncbi:hypothetical protein AVEN_99931-1 [Araneus ventricosus]|uniref:Uncharacterized protein n=1 Tax=Araneus ventricosus TaxID=182803 RepID=A0A4Y2MEM1_ARAVE|nr:hypothetical protein AVEN_99931-1 [Araneus ventricosus]